MKRRKEREEKRMSKILKKTNGITLIALVVTIVVLIILATISINAVMGDDGLIQKAEKASQMQANAEAADREAIEELTKYIEEKIEGKDENVGELPEDSDNSSDSEESTVLVGYSYNGTVLPALPEYDKSNYPYSAIGFNQNTSTYMFIISPCRFYRSSESDCLCVPEACTTKTYSPVDNENSWEIIATETHEAGNSFAYLPIFTGQWSSFDILNEDGTTYLAASEPVPIYE